MNPAFDWDAPLVDDDGEVLEGAVGGVPLPPENPPPYSEKDARVAEIMAQFPAPTGSEDDKKTPLPVSDEPHDNRFPLLLPETGRRRVKFMEPEENVYLQPADSPPPYEPGRFKLPDNDEQSESTKPDTDTEKTEGGDSERSGRRNSKKDKKKKGSKKQDPDVFY